MTTEESTSNGKSNAKPTHTLRKKVGYGKQTDFETIGAAWVRDDGGLYTKLHGTQIIDGGIYAFPIKDKATDESGQ